MKKSLYLFLIMALVFGSLLVSCNANVEAPADELVSVTFEEGVSRSLSAVLEDFAKGDYYWKYAAKKNIADTSGLTYGTTDTYDAAGSVAVKTGKGLDAKVPGFSQGIWDFMLYAYRDSGYTQMVYSGETKAVVLQKGGPNLVTVTVSPLTEGAGTLFIDSTTLTPKTGSDTSTVSRTLKVVKVGESEQRFPTSGTTYSLEAGAYLVTVTYNQDGIVFAEGSVIATIYPNLKTTVSGSVDELVTYAQFDAEQNPDIIARTASTSGIESDDTDTSYSLTESVSDGAKVSASIPGDAARALLSDNSASLSLQLNVDTTDSSSTSVTLEIGMTAIETLNSEVTTTDVTSVSDYVTVTVQLQTGLESVSVKHSGNDMVNSTETDADLGQGIYSYDKATGVLTIKTKTFSPFQVSYASPVYVAKIGEKYYTSLEAAVSAVGSDETATIEMLMSSEGNGIKIGNGKNITFDLKGFTYTISGATVGSTGTETQAFQLLRGTTVKLMNGTLTSTASAVQMLIQNYSNLTLENVTLDGTNLTGYKYVLSNNCGNISVTGSSSIITPEGGTAFDAYYWPSNGYSEGVSVTIDTTGVIEGTIELTADAEHDKYKNYVSIKNGTFSGDFNNERGNLTITGGLFASDPSDYVSEYYEAVQNEYTGYWTIISRARDYAEAAGAVKIEDNGSYVLGTLSDGVVYRFDYDGKTYIYDAKDYNGWDGENTDVSVFTVGKLIGVTGIGQNAFSSNTTVTTLKFDSPISTAYKSFEGNTKIKEVYLDNLTVIPDRMFYRMNGVKNVVIPEGVTRIEDWGFYACTGVETIEVAESVEYIGYKAFDGCSALKDIDIKGSPAIMGWAGRGLTSLENLYLRGEDTTYLLDYAPDSSARGGFVFARTQAGNPGDFGYTVHVASKSAFDAFALSNGQGSSSERYTKVIYLQ